MRQMVFNDGTNNIKQFQLPKLGSARHQFGHRSIQGHRRYRLEEFRLNQTKLLTSHLFSVL